MQADQVVIGGIYESYSNGIKRIVLGFRDRGYVDYRVIAVGDTFMDGGKSMQKTTAFAKWAAKRREDLESHADQ